MLCYDLTVKSFDLLVSQPFWVVFKEAALYKDFLGLKKFCKYNFKSAINNQFRFVQILLLGCALFISWRKGRSPQWVRKVLRPQRRSRSKSFPRKVLAAEPCLSPRRHPQPRPRIQRPGRRDPRWGRRPGGQIPWTKKLNSGIWGQSCCYLLV